MDTYEGAPTIVTAFFAIVPKIATLGVIITLVNGPFLGLFPDLQPEIPYIKNAKRLAIKQRQIDQHQEQENMKQHDAQKHQQH